MFFIFVMTKILKRKFKTKTKQHLFHGTGVGSYAEVQRIFIFCFTNKYYILHIIYHIQYIILCYILYKLYIIYYVIHYRSGQPERRRSPKTADFSIFFQEKFITRLQ